VDLGAMVRPTASPGLYLQQAGRLLRTEDGKKDACLLDFACNVFRHGLLTNVRGVSKSRKADEDDGPKGRECPKCATISEPGSTSCAECGYVWPIIQRGNAEEKLTSKSLAEKVMDEAIWAPVLNATFRHNEPQGRPRTLQLLYLVPIEGRNVQATEVWCFDHDPDSWAAKKARADWSKRTGQIPPESVLEAAQRIEELQRPRFVRVVQSDCGKYYNVKGVRF
jgi:DNA repair protein RadD